MGKKYEVRRRSALSGTKPKTITEGCWLDTDRTLEQNPEVDEAEARWCFWMESYELSVLLGDRWFLSAGIEEEDI
jgi:hypothetical protein